MACHRSLVTKLSLRFGADGEIDLPALEANARVQIAEKPNQHAQSSHRPQRCRDKQSVDHQRPIPPAKQHTPGPAERIKDRQKQHTQHQRDGDKPPDQLTGQRVMQGGAATSGGDHFRCPRPQRTTFQQQNLRHEGPPAALDPRDEQEQHRDEHLSADREFLPPIAGQDQHQREWTTEHPEDPEPAPETVSQIGPGTLPTHLLLKHDPADQHRGQHAGDRSLNNDQAGHQKEVATEGRVHLLIMNACGEMWQRDPADQQPVEQRPWQCPRGKA